MSYPCLKKYTTKSKAFFAAFSAAWISAHISDTTHALGEWEGGNVEEVVDMISCMGEAENFRRNFDSKCTIPPISAVLLNCHMH